MIPLIQFELRKMVRRKATFAGMAIIVIISILLTLSTVSGESRTDQNGQEITGLSAVSLAREQTHEQAGRLTTKKIGAAIERYHAARNNPQNLNGEELSDKAYGQTEQKDAEILSLIRQIYSPKAGYDYYVINKLTSADASHFYQKRMDKVQEYLDTDYTYGNYSVEDKAIFVKMNQKIAVPFAFDYTDGWKNVLLNLWIIIFAAAFIICVCVSPVFSGEYQSGADSIILSSRYGRSKVIRAKFWASIILTTGLFLASILIFTLLILAIYGYFGWNSNLQIIQFRAPFPLTLMETYIWSVLLGFLACLLMMTFTLVLSAKMKAPFYVIICSAIVLLGPMFIPYSKSSRFFNHIINLFPVKMMNGYSSFSHYELYHVLGYSIPEPYAMAGTAVILSIVLLPLAYKGFRNHQVA
ncbi:ABC transporter permease subunit [Paenibacillus tuaregi]|uniref:ABC transporter permease subunit n=1 Tax=Paenibacillus tuaregi TaxID=1816681 RepID=UPI0008384C34|nr:ABC transporter permease subunit [Paenibacillus tuaregi]